MTPMVIEAIKNPVYPKLTVIQKIANKPAQTRAPNMIHFLYPFNALN